MTIYYFAPIHRSLNGGLRTIQRHVHVLCEAGIDAALLYPVRPLHEDALPVARQLPTYFVRNAGMRDWLWQIPASKRLLARRFDPREPTRTLAPGLPLQQCRSGRRRELTDRDVLTPDAPLKIDIRVDEDANTLEVEDTGIGMTHDDLVERIGTVASSGTLSFLEEIQQSGKPLDAQLIGQFGVGFYAAFMVADEIQIATRHADKDSQGYLWRSKGEGSYTIEKFDREIRGTRITKVVVNMGVGKAIESASR